MKSICFWPLAIPPLPPVVVASICVGVMTGVLVKQEPAVELMATLAAAGDEGTDDDAALAVELTTVAIFELNIKIEVLPPLPSLLPPPLLTSALKAAEPLVVAIVSLKVNMLLRLLLLLLLLVALVIVMILLLLFLILLPQPKRVAVAVSDGVVLNSVSVLPIGGALLPLIPMLPLPIATILPLLLLLEEHEVAASMRAFAGSVILLQEFTLISDNGRKVVATLFECLTVMGVEGVEFMFNAFGLILPLALLGPALLLVANT